jgi:uncharacterized protein
MQADQELRVQMVPTGQTDRLHSLDLIRGIAVLGILIANVTAFGHPSMAYYWPTALPGGGSESDRIAWLVQYVLVDGKFRGLFSILFGAGLILFVERKRDIDRAMVLQWRRLALLALFGLLHFALLFRGDILFGYAIAGFFALFFLRMPAEKLFAIGIIWALVGSGLQVLNYLTPALIETGAAEAGRADAIAYYSDYWQERLFAAQAQADVMAHGSYLDVLRYRVVEESGLLVGYFTYGFFETIPLMLIGMGFYRSGMFTTGTDTSNWRWAALAALLAGIAINLAMGLHVYRAGFPPYLTQLAFFGVSGVANTFMLLGGTALLAQWATQASDGWLVERLSRAGRMALSNYVGTSLVMVLIFQGWAGGLYGTMGKLDMLPVILLGWAWMIAFSRIWLARYRYGPLEWLWRCLTYGQRFPLKRRES